jgi:ABC-2 type transport system permease protein
MLETLMLGWRAIIGRAYPRVVAGNREPDWLIYEVGLPLLRVLAFVFVYRALKAPPQYTGYVILGGAMTAFWLNVLWSMASQLYWERQSGNLELYLMAPPSLMYILVGMALGGVFATMIRAVTIVVLGSLLFGVAYQLSQWPLLLLVFLLTLVALYGLGSLLASLYLFYSREVWNLTELMTDPIYLLTGFYFPVRALGGVVGGIASIVPLTLGLDAMRQILFPGGSPVLLSAGTETALLGVLAVVCCIAAYWSLRVIEYLARRDGKLTIKWQ